MKRLLLLVLVLLAAGCSSTPTAPTAPAASPPPTLIQSAAATVPPATTLPTATPPSPAVLSPMVQQHFSLRELPGIGRGPYAMAALGDKLYVVNAGSNNVAVIQNERVLKYIPVGKRPGAIAVDPAARRVYVGNADDNSISLIVDDGVQLTQSLGEQPSALVFADNRLVAGAGSKAMLFFLDPATLKTQNTITFGKGTTIVNLAADPGRHRIYADLYEQVGIVDSTNQRVVNVFETKGSYYTLLASPPDGSVFTNQYESRTGTQYLVAHDPLSGAARGQVKINGDPRGLTMNADGSRVYVANAYSNDVSVIDPRSMTSLALIPVGLQPYAVELMDNGRRLYVANYESDSLNVVDTEKNQVVATIPLGMFPTATAFNESAGRVYVANASTDSVYVVEGTRVVREIPVGRHPIDLARDEQSNRLLVANAADRTLSIVDESTFTVRATDPITRFLTTVAVDAPRSRIFAGDVVLDLKSLAPIDALHMGGIGVATVISPDSIRVNPNLNRVYAIGWNGIPGSNSRSVTYSVDGSALARSTVLGYAGNTTALTIDPETNRVFIAGTHPLAYTNELNVFDANNARLVSLPLAARTTGLLYNPQTKHLFLSHATSYWRTFGPTPTPADKVVQVLDATSFGQVAELTVDSPGKLARLGNTIYVVSRDNGLVSLIQDANVPPPPSPTPTFTLTPYRTSTPGPLTLGVTPTPYIPTGTPRAATPAACSIPVTALASQVWTPQVAARIGCPTETQRPVTWGAQLFERGAMYWRGDEKRIYVLFGDMTWTVFDDKWTESLPEDSCPKITVPAGQVKPKRGFGKVWCEQTAVSSKIGAATGGEMGGYTAPVQKFQRGLMMGTDSGGLLVLYADGKWE